MKKTKDNLEENTPPYRDPSIPQKEIGTRDRFEFETQLFQCWHITEDIDTVIKSTDNMVIDAKARDELLNMLIGLRVLYHNRFSHMFELFEELVKTRKFT